jgi:hypothetical protein
MKAQTAHLITYVLTYVTSAAMLPAHIRLNVCESKGELTWKARLTRMKTGAKPSTL